MSKKESRFGSLSRRMSIKILKDKDWTMSPSPETASPDNSIASPTSLSKFFDREENNDLFQTTNHNITDTEHTPASPVNHNNATTAANSSPASPMASTSNQQGETPSTPSPGKQRISQDSPKR